MGLDCSIYRKHLIINELYIALNVQEGYIVVLASGSVSIITMSWVQDHMHAWLQLKLTPATLCDLAYMSLYLFCSLVTGVLFTYV